MNFPSQIYIAGELADGASTKEIVNLATENWVATASMQDAKRALQKDSAVFPIWGATSIAKRQKWMLALRDEVVVQEKFLRSDTHHEMGNPWSQTEEDWDRLVVSLDYFREEIARFRDLGLIDRAGTHTHQMAYEPAGVVLAFLTWNFPLLSLAFKIGPAMAAGCPIVIRPCKATPIPAYAVGALCPKIGMPKGVFQILWTDGYATADAMTASSIPALVTLNESTKTGQNGMRTGASSINPYFIGLGGNAPVLVFGDANLELAADIITGIKFSTAGQICAGPNRIYVAQEILKAFSEKVGNRARAAKIKFDEAADIKTDPVIDAAVAQGASLLAGGDRPEGLTVGQYLAPTVLDDVAGTMDIYLKETWGPIVSIVPFADETLLLEMANDCEENGMTAYIFTQKLTVAEYFRANLRYGEIQIDGVKYDIDLPHGGIRQSGIRYDCSYLALNDYPVQKRITRALNTTIFGGLNP